MNLSWLSIFFFLNSCFIPFRENLPIERFWPEIKPRVNYPIKQASVEIDNTMQIDMDNYAFKFCLSAVGIKVTGSGLQLIISSWNENPIAGKFKISLLLYNSVI